VGTEVVKMSMLAFWVVMLYGLVHGYQLSCRNILPPPSGLMSGVLESGGLYRVRRRARQRY
jgi:hypothetical protein